MHTLKHPDWYPDWRHDAVHQLQAKVARLKTEFRLDEWPRYDYDLDARTLTFSQDGSVKVVAEIQIVGTTSFNAGDWLWGWANSHWPVDCVTDAQRVRAFGEEHGICELTHESINETEDLNALGWALTAVATRIVDAIGAYRPKREEGGGFYLIYKNMTWAS